MPNGGYPITLLLPIEHTDLALRLEGASIHVARMIDDETWPSAALGELTEVQTCALLFHLNYWGAANSRVDSHGITDGWFGTHRLEPKFTSPGCRYDL